ncbi:MAG: sulfotransferase [Sphingomonadaceae bacterium]|nr:sulfotransferase [Sphingomonadaceae bacterium]
MTVHICMWSGPRNLSTAMMRSFSSRADTCVTDEPFYGAYLRETGDPQPMAGQVITAMDCDWHRVAEAMRGPSPDGSPVWYQKHMSHHMEGPVSIGDFPDARHAFLIRDPRRVAASYANKRSAIRPEHLGVARQLEYFRQIASKQATPPPVIDSDDILQAPEQMLRKLCEALALEWDPAMLSWVEGSHPSDGVWGAHWYDKVNASTGFGSPPGSAPELSEEYAEVAQTCMADYLEMRRFAIPAG